MAVDSSIPDTATRERRAAALTRPVPTANSSASAVKGELSQQIDGRPSTPGSNIGVEVVVADGHVFGEVVLGHADTVAPCHVIDELLHIPGRHFSESPDGRPGVIDEPWPAQASPHRSRQHVRVPLIHEFNASDTDDVVALSLRAWAPVHISIREALGPEINDALQPDWRATQQADVEGVLEAAASKVWVADIDGVVAGFVAVRIHDDGRIGEIDMLAVDPPRQGLGIGHRAHQSCPGLDQSLRRPCRHGRNRCRSGTCTGANGTLTEKAGLEARAHGPLLHAKSHDAETRDPFSDHRQLASRTLACAPDPVSGSERKRFRRVAAFSNDTCLHTGFELAFTSDLEPRVASLHGLVKSRSGRDGGVLRGNRVADDQRRNTVDRPDSIGGHRVELHGGVP